ncbi:MAG TPA: TonB family protein [Terriglobales bacterium]|nr:TonB family protein [Terriglobales bacterium]
MSPVSLVFSSDRETARWFNQVLIELEFDVEHRPEIFGAIEELTSRRFDVIACDWGEGLEAAFLLKTSRDLKLNQTAFTVVIADRDSAADVRKAGADLVLIKPLISEKAKRQLLHCEKFLAHIRTLLPKLGFSAPEAVHSPAISRRVEERPCTEWPKVPQPSLVHRNENILPVVPAFAFNDGFFRENGVFFGQHSDPPKRRDTQGRHRKHYRRFLRGAFPQGRVLQIAAIATVFLSVGYVFSEPLSGESHGPSVAKICGQALQRTAAWFHGTETAELRPKPATDDSDGFFIPPTAQSRFRSHVSPVVRSVTKPVSTADSRPEQASVAPPQAAATITASVEIPDSLKKISPGLRTAPVATGSSFLSYLEPVSLSEDFAQKLLLQKVQPSYPEQAIRAGLQGSVILQAWIARDGSIRDLKLVRGSLFLGRAAYNAVKQWRYQPYVLNGRPVEAQTYVTVDFRLP